MLDLNNGTLFFDDGTEVNPSIDRDKFLTSPLEAPTKPDENSAPPWHIYTLRPRLLDGINFASRLSFRDDALELLAIWNVDVEEAKRADRHDVWLLRQAGQSTYVHDWGKVEAVTEPGGANIILFSYL
jgi:hypothetical protein